MAHPSGRHQLGRRCGLLSGHGEQRHQRRQLSQDDGEPLKLVITRTVERTCATEIVLAGTGIRRDLPLNQPVEITLTPDKAGTMKYACAMGMVGGVLLVE